MEGWVGLGTTMVSKQSAQDRYVMEITVVSCSDCHALLVGWLHTYKTYKVYPSEDGHPLKY